MVDPEVLARFAAGDPDAVRAVYGAYGRLVYAVAYKLLGDRGLAEEATQQTFVQAWRASASYDPAREVGPWLAIIARRRMGVRVPADLSIVTWDDSALCELVHPALTALRRDIPAAGASAVRMLSEAVAGRPPGHVAEAPPVLIVRDSAGPPPGNVPAPSWATFRDLSG